MTRPSPANGFTPMLAGVTNFRDFGGLETASGVTRKDRLYRSGHFDAIAPAAREVLAQLAFTLIADLRYLGERSRQPLPWAPKQLRNLLTPTGEPDGEAPHVRLLKSPDLDAAKISDFYMRFYASVPFDPAFQPVFAEFLQRLAATDGRVLLHCSIGKDRTGILAALVCASLGVREDLLIADYLRSRDETALPEMVQDVNNILEAQLGHRASQDIAMKLLSVDADYLDFKLCDDQVPQWFGRKIS